MGKQLSHYQKRKPADSAGVRRSTRRTKKMKRAIVGLVGLLVVLMVVWPLTNMGKRSFKVNLASGTAPTDEKPHMIKPRLHGMDKDGQPYNITAREAMQETKDSVVLHEVEGDIYRKNGGWIALNAATGYYNVTEKTLDLIGNVDLLTDGAYELATEKAHVILSTKEVQGDVPVSLQGPLGTLTADTFRLQGAMNTIIFTGNVHLKVYSKAGKKK